MLDIWVTQVTVPPVIGKEMTCCKPLAITMGQELKALDNR